MDVAEPARKAGREADANNERRTGRCAVTKQLD
jgi:hypothetical protein